MDYLSSTLSTVVKEAEDEILWTFMKIMKNFTGSTVRDDNWNIIDRIEENVKQDHKHDSKRIMNILQSIGKLVLFFLWNIQFRVIGFWNICRTWTI